MPTGRNRCSSAAILAASSCALALVLAALLAAEPAIEEPIKLAPAAISAGIAILFLLNQFTLGVQTIAEVVGDHAVRFHIATVMYGWRLAFVPLEPADAVVPETVWAWLGAVDKPSTPAPASVNTRRRII
jgi:hypothetical protein